MDLNLLFKISHGLYLTGARDDKKRLIGSCVDAVMVAEVAPAQILISMTKMSYTCQNVLKTGFLTLSVLPDDTSDDLIKIFGTTSSQNTDKWAKTNYDLMDNLPVLRDAVAGMLLKTVSRQETTTHYIFLCDVVRIQGNSNKNPMIYANYQKNKENKKMSENEKWVCTICGYVYDGDIPFEQLPEDWVCPLCGEPKSVFVKE